MCGRFETLPSIQSLIQTLQDNNIDIKIKFNDLPKKNKNIAPAEEIFSISNTGQDFFLSKTNWGIKFSPDSPLIFNSRIETIREKKFWQNLFDNNRLLVPMTGFYEWKKENNKKIPYRIYLPDEKIFFVPALFHVDKDQNIQTSLITTKPNEFIRKIHHRMPVILRITEGIQYLVGDKESNLNKCIPYTGEMLMERADI